MVPDPTPALTSAAVAYIARAALLHDRMSPELTSEFLTANGRDSADNPSYYVFDSCTVAAASGETVEAASVYLGRPWGTYSRTVFQKSSLSAIVNPEGWHAW